MTQTWDGAWEKKKTEKEKKKKEAYWQITEGIRKRDAKMREGSEVAGRGLVYCI